MILSIEYNDFFKLISAQVSNNFILTSKEEEMLALLVPKALLRTANCLKENINKYYWNETEELIFNPYHSGQYAIFLYFLSRSAIQNSESILADKIYYLNKMLNSCDLYHGVKLPDVFFFDHPLGSVLGRAEYSNYFIFQQNCTVGNNHSKYPKFGEFVWLFANTTVIGESVIGNNVFISAGTYIKDEIIPDNTIVFGRSPNLILKSKPIEYFHNASPFKIHQKKEC